MGVVSVVLAITYHYVNSEGMIANADGTRSIVSLYSGTFVPEVSKASLERILHDQHTVIIDARLQQDYEDGHIGDAVNIPIGSNEAARSAITAKFSKDANIVVYCQSAQCKFAETVASQLLAEGFSKVSIFKGGWLEWSDKT